MVFPLKDLKVHISHDPNSWMLRDFNKETEIPVSKDSPASFLYQRKNHQHEGVDLYCEKEQVFVAMVEGIITNIIPFTGEIAGFPWWNDTYGVIVEDIDGVWIYGEIEPLKELKIGQKIKEGEVIGNVIPVLKNNKNNRPMCMLHLERYIKGINESIGVLKIGKPAPDFLLDPTRLLVSIIKNN